MARLTANDEQATRTVIEWVKSVQSKAERSVIRDPDLRLVATEYTVPGMGTKVETVRSGSLVAWFDSANAARAAIRLAIP